MSPARWLRLDVSLGEAPADPNAAYALTEALVGLGAASVQEQGGSLTTYFEEPRDPGAHQSRVEEHLARAANQPLTCSWSWQAHEDWAELWRQGFTAHDIGERLRVRPPWITSEPNDRLEIEIDPGVAFGTAEHGSTRSCLTLVERFIRGSESVLDVGAGSGVLSIAALILGAAHATCVEIDAMACEALRENAERNGVHDRVKVVCEPFMDETTQGAYQLVVCNMVSSRLLPILPALIRRTSPGGRIILGGLQPEEVVDVTHHLASLVSHQASPTRVDDEGWCALSILTPDFRA